MSSEPFLWMAGPVIAIGLLRYRADLRARGHTTVLGVALLLAAWLMPHLVLGYAIPMFPVPRAPRQWAGYGLMAAGLIGCGLVLRGRFTPAMFWGRDAKTLCTAGPYRWSRNPQYVAYTLFPVGYALTGVAALAWVGVALYVLLVHLTVLVEEEHLDRRFGDAYRDYRRMTPRYFGRRGARDRAGAPRA